MRANSLVFAIPILLGISLPLGPPALLTEPAAGQEEPAPPDPTWQRLGLPESPTPESGRGVGIVLMDMTTSTPPCALWANGSSI